MIQIKPQLEKLLNIPDDSLTKEIQLTQVIIKSNQQTTISMIIPLIVPFLSGSSQLVHQVPDP